jgi:hypothetical protein
MKTTAWLQIVLIVTVGSGCAGAPRTTALKVDAPAASPTRALGSVEVSVNDARVDRSLDEILSNRPADVTREAIITAINGLKALNGQSHLATMSQLSVELERLDWLVPGYEAMLRKAYLTSFLTGGLGGLAYGSTDTTVQGHATLKIRMRQSGREVLNKEYVGFYEEKIDKLRCDSLETKSRVAGLALSSAIEGLITDINSLPPPASDSF